MQPLVFDAHEVESIKETHGDLQSNRIAGCLQCHVVVTLLRVGVLQRLLHQLGGQSPVEVGEEIANRNGLRFVRHGRLPRLLHLEGNAVQPGSIRVGLALPNLAGVVVLPLHEARSAEQVVVDVFGKMVVAQLVVILPEHGGPNLDVKKVVTQFGK